MVKLTLYGIDPSPPVRAVQLTLKALGLPYDYIQVNLFTNEELKPEYRAKNPTHTVPTLEDDGHFIWESHAINAYLVNKYGKTDALYPKDPLKRAVVDQRLHFESGTLFYGTLRNITRPLLLQNITAVPQQKINAIAEIYDFMEIFLKETAYVAGEHLTIADFSLIASITTLDAVLQIEKSKYPKLSAWIERIKQLPYYQEACGKGAEQLSAMIKSKNIQIVA